MAIGPSGWTRTTTSRVKSPACCVHTTKGEWSLERMAGLEPAPQGLEGPQATVTPHSHLVRPTGIEPVPPRWQRGMHSSTPRPNVDRCRSPAHRDPSIFKDPALASTAARTARLATAPGFEPGPASFGGSDAPVTPRCRRCFTSRPFSETEPPRDLARAFFRAIGQNKKGLLGDRPRRPGSQ